MAAPRVNVLVDPEARARFREATLHAVEHARVQLGVDVSVGVVPTGRIDHNFLTDFGQGVIVGPGSPYRNPEGVLDVIRLARERGVPLVGT